jgi:hypothetical protein
MTPPRIPFGSATQVVSAPELRKRLAITDLSLRSVAFGPNQASGKPISIRLASDGDAAVRRFHKDEAVTYEFRLFQGDEPVETRLLVLHDDAKIYRSDPLPAAQNSPYTGTYVLTDYAPGRYLLGIQAEEQDLKHKGASISEWVDFEVVQ